MRLPFVGLDLSASDQYSFGAIFNNSKPATSSEDYYSVSQYYHKAEGGYESVTYYIPTRLATVYVSSGPIPLGGFAACSYITSIYLEKGVSSIGENAFDSCVNLTVLEIPNTVQSIGLWAFNGCSRLTQIKYDGSKASWQALMSKNSIIFDYPNNSTTVKKIVCNDGDISI